MLSKFVSCYVRLYRVMHEGCIVLYQKVVSCYTRRLSRVIQEGCIVLCKVVSCYEMLSRVM